MTLDELLVVCCHVVDEEEDARDLILAGRGAPSRPRAAAAARIAQAVIDMLSVPRTCLAFNTHANSMGTLYVEGHGVMTPAEARGAAAEILRAADAADEERR